jgi:hypothetical protein
MLPREEQQRRRSGCNPQRCVRSPNPSLTFIDITGSLVYALTVPYAAIALTLYYFDLATRQGAASATNAAISAANSRRLSSQA